MRFREGGMGARLRLGKGGRMAAMGAWLANAFEAKITIGDLLSFASIMFAAISLIVQGWRGIQVQQIELYQRLETNSMTVFKFEADHAVVLERFRDSDLDEMKFSEPALANGTRTDFNGLIAAFGSMRGFIDHYGDLERSGLDDALKPEFLRFEQEYRVVQKYYEQTMNLFEMAARFRRKRIIEPEVYGSWVIWFHDTLNEWAFRALWPELKQNYTPELRHVFNGPVRTFDPNEDDTKRKRHFFQHVAQITGCRVIGDWLRRLEAEEK